MHVKQVHTHALLSYYHVHQPLQTFAARDRVLLQEGGRWAGMQQHSPPAKELTPASSACTQIPTTSKAGPAEELWLGFAAAAQQDEDFSLHCFATCVSSLSSLREDAV